MLAARKGQRGETVTDAGDMGFARLCSCMSSERCVKGGVGMLSGMGFQNGSGSHGVLEVTKHMKTLLCHECARVHPGNELNGIE